MSPAFDNPGAPWLGRRAFVMGSGDSLRQMPASTWRRLVDCQVAGDRFIAANSSAKTAMAAGLTPDALFFTDGNWFDDNRDFLARYPGMVLTICRRAKAAMPDRILLLDNVHRPDFPVGRPPFKDGRTSGHRAVSAAIYLGGAPVVLIGFDMRLDPATGRSHCHDDYARRHPAQLYTNDFLPAFTGWDHAARRAGVDVFNATPGSALDEFRRADLESLLPPCAA